jgi:hypothetical protein
MNNAFHTLSLVLIWRLLYHNIFDGNKYISLIIKLFQ